MTGASYSPSCVKVYMEQIDEQYASVCRYILYMDSVPASSLQYLSLLQTINQVGNMDYINGLFTLKECPTNNFCFIPCTYFNLFFSHPIHVLEGPVWQYNVECFPFVFALYLAFTSLSNMNKH